MSEVTASREVRHEAAHFANLNLHNKERRPMMYEELTPGADAIELSKGIKDIVSGKDKNGGRKVLSDYFEARAAVDYGKYSFSNFSELKAIVEPIENMSSVDKMVAIDSSKEQYLKVYQVYVDLIDGVSMGVMWGRDREVQKDFRKIVIEETGKSHSDGKSIDTYLGLDPNLGGLGEVIVNTTITDRGLIRMLDLMQGDIGRSESEHDPRFYDEVDRTLKKLLMTGDYLEMEWDDRSMQEADMVQAYLASIAGGARILQERRSRGTIEIPDSQSEQLKLMRSAVEVFETLYKAPGEGLEIMDQTVIFNSFILDSLKGADSVVDGRVLQEMKARVRNLVVAKSMMAAGGFMPSDRQGLDVVSAIERLRGTGDLLNSDDLDYFFRGDGNGLPIREVWNLRQEWDFGISYEDSIKRVVGDYDRYKDESVVVEMFARYGLENNAENFEKMMFNGIYDESEGKNSKDHVDGWFRPTKGVPFFADRGQTFSEDSNVLRKDVMKRSLEMSVRDSGVDGAEANFKEAWGIVDLLRYSTAEDIRARINLEGHYTIWEGMSGVLNNLDRSGKLKQSADLNWVGQMIVQAGAPYLCYVMHHDIHTPLFAEEINPLAFLDPKTDLSYWSAWIKTTQKAADYLNSGLDQKSLGATVKSMYDVVSKTLKAPTIVNMGGDIGYIDNMMRDGSGDFVLDKDKGVREIDKDKSKIIGKRMKELFVRQAIQGLINLSETSNGDEIEGIAKIATQFRNEVTMTEYSGINYNQAAEAIKSVQPSYQELFNKAGKMTQEQSMKAAAFMTPSEFDKVLSDLGFDKTKWAERGKDAGLAIITGLLGVDGKKK
ncbi:hypothetical protein KKD37_00740 [Patescibacteria group bacterium]|nr:hypothetical protein [Patescibacteria group bacterium]